MKKHLPLIMSCLLAMQILGGCGIGDKISALRESFRQEEGGETADLEVPEVIVLPDGTTTLEPAGTNLGIDLTAETKAVILYFTDQEGEQLIAEERQISKVEGIARATVEALLAGPENGDLQSALPEGTQLMDINIKEDGLAIVDFSKALAENLESSSKKEKLAVYSIVNTLTQFPTVNRVEIRIDGKTVNSLKGKVKLDQDLFRDEALIKKP